MKLAIVIICWNDRKVIMDCLRSIYLETKTITYEVIVSDNGSTDVVVPRQRGQQLKDQAQLDGWLRDGSAATVDNLCAWT